MVQKTGQMVQQNLIQQQVHDWLERVVIGLQLCPFAQKPLRARQLRILVSNASDIESALLDVDAEIHFLEQHGLDGKHNAVSDSANSGIKDSIGGNVSDRVSTGFVETTLLVLPKMFADFYDFNDFLSIANELLESNAWQGVYQLASFHPRYQFAGTEADDAENLTNVAPYPIVHILREQSVSEAVDNYAAIDDIPERNIQRMNALTEDQRATLFPFLLSSKSGSL